jgi:hypothetical protein
MNSPWLKKNGGMLDSDKHRALIARRVEFAKDARIPDRFIWEPLPKAFTEEETDYLQKFKSQRGKGYSGLLLTGSCAKMDPLTRFWVMAGFLVRNYVRARVYPLNEVTEVLNNGGNIEATCLLIPDFIVDQKDKSNVKNWRVQQLTQFLIERGSAGGTTQTVLYAPSVKAIATEYGTYVANVLKNHYLNVEVA